MISDLQKEQRKRFIGSSDTAALFGLDPFKPATDVYVDKVFDLEKELPESEAMDIGNRYEGVLLDYASDKLGYPIERNLTFISDTYPIFACNLDGLIIKEDGTCEIVEAKTTGMADEWGKESTDEVPDRVLLQVHHQMLCTGFKTAHVVALIGKFGLKEKIYKVDRNDELIKTIIDTGSNFWYNNVIPKIPPKEDIKRPEIIRYIKRINKLSNVNKELIDAYLLAKADRLRAEEIEEQYKARIELELGECDGAEFDDGTKVTFFKQKGADIVDVKALKEKYADIYKTISKPNEYRVLRIKTPKD